MLRQMAVVLPRQQTILDSATMYLLPVQKEEG